MAALQDEYKQRYPAASEFPTVPTIADIAKVPPSLQAQENSKTRSFRAASSAGVQKQSRSYIEQLTAQPALIPTEFARRFSLKPGAVFFTRLILVTVLLFSAWQRIPALFPSAFGSILWSLSMLFIVCR